MYPSWDIECNRQFFAILAHFLSFYPNKNPENKILQKRKNTWSYYYFIHVYHKWQSWCMVPEIWSATVRPFYHFGPFYAVLSYLVTWKMKMFKKWKKKKKKKNTWRYYHFTHAPKIMIIWWCMVPEIWSEMFLIFLFYFSFCKRIMIFSHV